MIINSYNNCFNTMKTTVELNKKFPVNMNIKPTSNQININEPINGSLLYINLVTYGMSTDDILKIKKGL